MSRDQGDSRFIFVTGGVVSALGKGIASASIGRLLVSRGFRVQLQKFDPYINVDPGTMSPFQHGEVFVTEDGAETDLDLGHYERFTDENTSRASNVTAGAVYNSVITTSGTWPWASGPAIARTRLLISSVMCGMTWTVSPRYSPRRSRAMTCE